jgi:hypothetical protein
MHLSLGRIDSNLKRKAVPTRILAALWSFVLVLTLTPCCEVFATALPTHADQGQMDAHGSHNDIGDGPCVPWLNVSLNALDSASALLSVTSSPENPVVLSHVSGFPSPRTRRPDVLDGVHAPPPVPRPLYLRFVRFLE